MLNLQTKVDIPQPNFSINYSSSISLFGSCFSDNIGNLLKKHKFSSSINPFGVLYNPASISQNIDLLFAKDKFTESDLNHFNDLWFSFYHHSSFSSNSQSECLSGINKTFTNAKNAINNANVVIFTLGTSWIYRYNKNKSIVANCHKIPAKEFSRESLSVEEIVAMLSKNIEQIKANSAARFIFTVSPIRHWKDGAIENMRSKATLLLAIKQLQELFEEVYYFPSYEIFMDELRDYRYYASDMLHPSDFAIQYLWEIFKSTFFTSETIQTSNEVLKLVKSYAHRINNTDTDQYLKFKTSLINSTKLIEAKYPSINFEDEKSQLF